MQNQRSKREMAERLEGRLGLSTEQWLKVIETLSAILLSLAALGTSWSGYQAGLWNGQMATRYNQAGALRVESVRNSGIASRNVQLDVQLFTDWLEAVAAKNQALADFYRTRFRPEFVPAFEAWLASRPLENPQAASSPFEMPEYRLAAQEEANRLEREAGEMFDQGIAANQTADRYVLNTVILALVLFFSGLVSNFKLLFVRITLIAIAMALLTYGVSRLLVYPVL
ncbi:MAG: hypothetical protein RMK84_07130 [Oscillochloridaceae bacterium]|nr:hypothetical protein [Chloroflexaceae bacterium]MDW8389882.1 hypothetical protein [Oscillochloridaceae bacterium]